MIQIREEQAEDKSAIRLINEKAFGRPQEANLVDQLHQSCGNLLSLVAVIEDRLVGHILFSPTTIESHGDVIQGMGLAPMAVAAGVSATGRWFKVGSGGSQDSPKFVISLCHCPGSPALLPSFRIRTSIQVRHQKPVGRYSR